MTTEVQKPAATAAPEMTEKEWALTREVLQLKIMFCESQSQVLAANHAEHKRELAALGEKWEAPKA